MFFVLVSLFLFEIVKIEFHEFEFHLLVVDLGGKKPIRQVGFYERAKRAGDFARCGERFLFIFRLIPGSDTGNQEGIPCHTPLIRARRGNKDSGLRAAGHSSGLCPENPQAFRERLERKLH